MRVRHAQHLEHALDRAILAAAVVQRVEDDIGLWCEVGDELSKIARHVDLLDDVAELLKRRRAFAPAHERDVALCRPTAFQHGDAAHEAPPLFSRWGGSPMRRISHWSVMPLLALTRARTSSPRPSISAAVALPVLMRKLACFSDTIAPPRWKPRQPAWSISCHALWPAELAKVEPPVRARI